MQSEMADFAHGATTWRTEQNIRVIFDSGLFIALHKNMMSSTKQEVYNVLHCHHRRTEPRPQITCIENLLKSGLWCSRYTSRQMNKETDRHTNHNTVHPYQGRSNEVMASMLHYTQIFLKFKTYGNEGKFKLQRNAKIISNM